MDFGHFSVEVRAKPSGIRVTNARTGFVRIGCLFWKNKTLLQSLCFFPSRFLCDGYQTWSRTQQYAVMRRSTLWDVVVWSSSFQYLVANSNALQYGLVLFLLKNTLQYCVFCSTLQFFLVCIGALQYFVVLSVWSCTLLCFVVLRTVQFQYVCGTGRRKTLQIHLETYSSKRARMNLFDAVGGQPTAVKGLGCSYLMLYVGNLQQ